MGYKLIDKECSVLIIRPHNTVTNFSNEVSKREREAVQ